MSGPFDIGRVPTFDLQAGWRRFAGATLAANATPYVTGRYGDGLFEVLSEDALYILAERHGIPLEDVEAGDYEPEHREHEAVYWELVDDQGNAELADLSWCQSDDGAYVLVTGPGETSLWSSGVRLGGGGPPPDMVLLNSLGTADSPEEAAEFARLIALGVDDRPGLRHDPEAEVNAPGRDRWRSRQMTVFDHGRARVAFGPKRGPFAVASFAGGGPAGARLVHLATGMPLGPPLRRREDAMRVAEELMAQPIDWHGIRLMHLVDDTAAGQLAAAADAVAAADAAVRADARAQARQAEARRRDEVDTSALSDPFGGGAAVFSAGRDDGGLFRGLEGNAAGGEGAGQSAIPTVDIPRFSWADAVKFTDWPGPEGYGWHSHSGLYENVREFVRDDSHWWTARATVLAAKDLPAEYPIGAERVHEYLREEMLDPPEATDAVPELAYDAAKREVLRQLWDSQGGGAGAWHTGMPAFLPELYVDEVTGAVDFDDLADTYDGEIDDEIVHRLLERAEAELAAAGEYDHDALDQAEGGDGDLFYEILDAVDELEAKDIDAFVEDALVVESHDEAYIIVALDGDLHVFAGDDQLGTIYRFDPENDDDSHPSWTDAVVMARTHALTGRSLDRLPGRYGYANRHSQGNADLSRPLNEAGGQRWEAREEVAVTPAPGRMFGRLGTVRGDFAIVRDTDRAHPGRPAGWQVVHLASGRPIGTPHAQAAQARHLAAALQPLTNWGALTPGLVDGWLDANATDLQKAFDGASGALRQERLQAAREDAARRRARAEPVADPFAGVAAFAAGAALAPGAMPFDGVVPATARPAERPAATTFSAGRRPGLSGGEGLPRFAFDLSMGLSDFPDTDRLVLGTLITKGLFEDPVEGSLAARVMAEVQAEIAKERQGEFGMTCPVQPGDPRLSRLYEEAYPAAERVLREEFRNTFSSQLGHPGEAAYEAALAAYVEQRLGATAMDVALADAASMGLYDEPTFLLLYDEEIADLALDRLEEEVFAKLDEALFWFDDSGDGYEIVELSDGTCWVLLSEQTVIGEAAGRDEAVEMALTDAIGGGSAGRGVNRPGPDGRWEPRVYITDARGVEHRAGLVRGPLGLVKQRDGGPTTWQLLHLGSGLLLEPPIGDRRTALAAGARLAEDASLQWQRLTVATMDEYSAELGAAVGAALNAIEAEDRAARLAAARNEHEARRAAERAAAAGDPLGGTALFSAGGPRHLGPGSGPGGGTGGGASLADPASHPGSFLALERVRGQGAPVGRGSEADGAVYSSGPLPGPDKLRARFLAELERVDRSRDPAEIFRDVIDMTASAIAAQSSPPAEAARHEARYMEIVGRYGGPPPPEVHTLPRPDAARVAQIQRASPSWREAVQARDEALARMAAANDPDARGRAAAEAAAWYAVSVELQPVTRMAQLMGTVMQAYATDPAQDFLGPIYMDLASRGHRSWMGQFFTPWPVAELMARVMMTDLQERRGDLPITLAEPAAGSGVMVLAAAQVLRDAGMAPEEALHVTAIDLDPVCARMAFVQLALSGIPADVIHGNGLSWEVKEHFVTPAARMRWGGQDPHAAVRAVHEAAQRRAPAAAPAGTEQVGAPARGQESLFAFSGGRRSGDMISTPQKKVPAGGADVAEAPSFGPFRLVAAATTRSRAKTTSADQRTWEGEIGGRAVRLVSTVRTRSTIEQFVTPSNMRLRDGFVGRGGHFVDIKAKALDGRPLDQAELAVIGQAASAVDDRLVMVRQGRERVRTGLPAYAGSTGAAALFAEEEPSAKASPSSKDHAMSDDTLDSRRVAAASGYSTALQYRGVDVLIMRLQEWQRDNIGTQQGDGFGQAVMAAAGEGGSPAETLREIAENLDNGTELPWADRVAIQGLARVADVASEHNAGHIFRQVLADAAAAGPSPQAIVEALQRPVVALDERDRLAREMAQEVDARVGQAHNSGMRAGAVRGVGVGAVVGAGAAEVVDRLMDAAGATADVAFKAGQPGPMAPPPESATAPQAEQDPVTRALTAAYLSATAREDAAWATLQERRRGLEMALRTAGVPTATARKWMSRVEGKPRLDSEEAKKALAFLEDKAPGRTGPWLDAAVAAGAAGDAAYRASSELAAHGGLGVRLDAEAQTSMGELRRDLLATMARINPTLDVRFVRELYGEGQALIHSGVGTSDRSEVAGMYQPLYNLATISLTDRFDRQDTTYHEAFHSIEHVLGPDERRALETAFPPQAGMTTSERAAMAFAEWATARDRPAVPHDVRDAFRRLGMARAGAGSALRAAGLGRAEAVFERVYEGEMGRRALAAVEAARGGGAPRVERRGGVQYASGATAAGGALRQAATGVRELAAAWSARRHRLAAGTLRRPVGVAAAASGMAAAAGLVHRAGNVEPTSPLPAGMLYDGPVPDGARQLADAGLHLADTMAQAAGVFAAGQRTEDAAVLELAARAAEQVSSGMAQSAAQGVTVLRDMAAMTDAGEAKAAARLAASQWESVALAVSLAQSAEPSAAMAAGRVLQGMGVEDAAETLGMPALRRQQMATALLAMTTGVSLGATALAAAVHGTRPPPAADPTVAPSASPIAPAPTPAPELGGASGARSAAPPVPERPPVREELDIAWSGPRPGDERAWPEPKPERWVDADGNSHVTWPTWTDPDAPPGLGTPLGQDVASAGPVRGGGDLGGDLLDMISGALFSGGRPAPEPGLRTTEGNTAMAEESIDKGAGIDPRTKAGLAAGAGASVVAGGAAGAYAVADRAADEEVARLVGIATGHHATAVEAAGAHSEALRFLAEAAAGRAAQNPGFRVAAESLTTAANRVDTAIGTGDAEGVRLAMGQAAEAVRGNITAVMALRKLEGGGEAIYGTLQTSAGAHAAAMLQADNALLQATQVTVEDQLPGLMAAGMAAGKDGVRALGERAGEAGAVLEDAVAAAAARAGNALDEAGAVLKEAGDAVAPVAQAGWNAMKDKASEAMSSAVDRLGEAGSRLLDSGAVFSAGRPAPDAGSAPEPYLVFAGDNGVPVLAGNLEEALAAAEKVVLNGQRVEVVETAAADTAERPFLVASEVLLDGRLADIHDTFASVGQAGGIGGPHRLATNPETGTVLIGWMAANPDLARGI